MLHHRLTLTGTDDAVTTASAELVAMGATPVGAGCFITSRPNDAHSWREFAENHWSVRISVDVFEEFEDELVQTILTARDSVELSRRSVLPERFGCFDEDGEPIPNELLTAAGRAVAADRLAHDVGTLSSPLDDALTMAKALGRFCGRVEERIFSAPSESDLAAVRELAVFAWHVAVAPTAGGTAAELEFDHALALTQAVVQAGREELWDKPGRACWMSWTQWIIAAASDVIEAGSGGERAADEHLAFSARSLLTTCIQTLALFALEGDESE
jgi:hypothetical protein